MSGTPVNSYPLQTVLELACAAQRYNGSYVKQAESIITSDDKVVGYKLPNRNLISFALGEDKATYNDPALQPPFLKITSEDQSFATEIQKFYRRLAFTAIEGTDEFKTTINSLLNSTDIPINKLGFIACLPAQFLRDRSQIKMERWAKLVDQEFLGNVGSEIYDLDCEILACARSKTYDAYNIDAIINNKMVSWMGKNRFDLGPCVIIKAKIKGHTLHWKYENAVTRLNYVKAAQ